MTKFFAASATLLITANLIISGIGSAFEGAQDTVSQNRAERIAQVK